MRFSATEWKEFLEIGTRESSFDWDIPCGYITFGTCGMSIAKIIKKKWMRKFVNDWRNKTYKQVNDEIRQQEKVIYDDWNGVAAYSDTFNPNFYKEA